MKIVKNILYYILLPIAGICYYVVDGWKWIKSKFKRKELTAFEKLKKALRKIK